MTVENHCGKIINNFSEVSRTDFDVKIIRSKRKTLSLEISGSGEIIARAPLRMKDREIYSFVTSKHKWIEKHLLKIQNANNTVPTNALTRQELDRLYESAKKYLPKRVEYFANLIGTDYGRITVRCQKTKWGSCSSKGNLNFNCLLMLTPPEVIDSVVAHELCHRRFMNHSADFYRLLYSVFPDYDICSKWLKSNGSAIMQRVKK